LGLAGATAEIMGPDGSHFAEHRKTDDRSADDCLLGNPLAVMTLTPPAYSILIEIEHHLACAGQSRAAVWRQRPCATTSLSDTIKKSRKKGTNDNSHTA